MTNVSIYKDIAARTGGDIYIGIVGPVRTGKSTFIKQFMDKLVLPNISGDYQKERANDELPQSSSGRTIMTTEPKFIPEKGVQIKVDDSSAMNVRLIDCVGYIVPSALGYIEGDQPRMVMTPWFEEPIPFNMAAEIGTRKVINEHSTIGLVITTDGSISDIPRSEYEEAEERQRIDSQALHMLEVEAKRFQRSDDIRQRDLAADERRAESEADALQRAENVAAHEARVKRVQERAARQAAAARGETATPEARHEGNLMTPAEKAENVREYEAKQKEAIKRQERVRQKRAETQQKRDRKAAEEAADK